MNGNDCNVENAPVSMIIFKTYLFHNLKKLAGYDKGLKKYIYLYLHFVFVIQFNIYLDL